MRKYSFSEIHSMSIAEVMRRINEGEILRTERDALVAKLAECERERDDYRHRWADVSIALRLLACQPHAPNDHMTACDRTMGDSHPCTCTANDARVMLGAALASQPGQKEGA